MRKKTLLSFLIIVMLLTLSCFATENVVSVKNETVLENEITDEVLTTNLPENIGELTDENMDIFTVGATWDPTEVIEEPIIKEIEGIKPLGDNYFISNDENKTQTISKKEFKGNVFVIAEENAIIENSKIIGDLFIVSKNATIISTEVTGSIFVISETVITQDLNVEEVYMLAKKATVLGNINNEFKMIGEEIILDCVVNADVYVLGKNITLGEKAQLYGTTYIKYSEVLEKAESAVCKNLVSKESDVEVPEEAIENVQNTIKPALEIWKSNATKIIFEMLSTLIISGFVILFTANRFEEYNSNMTVKRFIFCTLKGILWFVLIPLFAFAIMIVSLGHFISIGLLIFIAYVYTIVFAIPIVSIVIADIIKSKTLEGEKHWLNLILSVIISAILWALVNLTGFVGFIIFVILCIISLGIMNNFIVFGNRIIKKAKKVDISE